MRSCSSVVAWVGCAAVALSGSPASSNQAVGAAEDFGTESKNLVNNLKVAAPTQITLLQPVDHGNPLKTNFEVGEGTAAAALREGDVLVETLYLTAGRYQRESLKSNRGARSGMVVNGYVAARVLESENSEYTAGDIIAAELPFVTVQVVTKQQLKEIPIWNLRGFLNEQTAYHAVGALGHIGAKAYGGLVGILKPVSGQTILVSAAAGRVGGLVGKMAKLVGCRVIGAVAKPSKIPKVKETQDFDIEINYDQSETAEDLKTRLQTANVTGIDMYFDNVGGALFEAAVSMLKPGGRVAVAGTTQQNDDVEVHISLGNMIYPQITIEGFTSKHWEHGEGNKEFVAYMGKLVKNGTIVDSRIKYNGLSSWPQIFEERFETSKPSLAIVKSNSWNTRRMRSTE